MKAIATKYRAPGNRRPARITASDLDGNRITVPYDINATSEQMHERAALALCRKMHWTGEMVSGELRECTVWVFLEHRAGERWAACRRAARRVVDVIAPAVVRAEEPPYQLVTAIIAGELGVRVPERANGAEVAV